MGKKESGIIILGNQMTSAFIAKGRWGLPPDSKRVIRSRSAFWMEYRYLVLSPPVGRHLCFLLTSLVLLVLLCECKTLYAPNIWRGSRRKKKRERQKRGIGGQYEQNTWYSHVKMPNRPLLSWVLASENAKTSMHREWLFQVKSSTLQMESITVHWCYIAHVAN